jgi:hypothetical protein
MPRATWMVHATVNEPPALLCAFVAHYLDLGADLVDLYLDRPSPEAERLLGGHDRVRLTVCTDDYWRAQGLAERPPLHMRRQVRNAARSYAALRHDWMLFCDADEFLVPEADFGGMLAALPPDVPFRRIRVVERVMRRDVPQQSIFDGIFRRPLPPEGQEETLRRAYGDGVAALLTKGLAGHVAGKSVLRRGTGLKPGLHKPGPRGLGPKRREAMMASGPGKTWFDGVTIAHFDGMTPLHYMLKLLHKHVTRLDAGVVEPSKRTKARQAQIAAVAASCSDAEALRRLQAILWLSPEAEATLRAAGGIAPVTLDPGATAQRLFPDAGFDYSAARFDAALRVQYAELIARTGFPL